MGFEMRTIDLRTSRLDWLKDYAGEIIMLALFAGMVYGVGLLMSTTAQAVDLIIEYAADIEQTQTEDDYQRGLVENALIEKRAREAVQLHPVTRAEMPPYWTAPEESK